MNENNQGFAALFPRASKSFIDANAQLFATHGKQDQGAALGSEAPREVKSNERPLVRIICFRVRRLDKENLYGSTKCLTDCLREVGLISGDSEAEINLQVTQEKVAHYHEQRTVVEITPWPTFTRNSPVVS